MLEINNDGLISMSRGDSVKLPLFINSGSDLCPVRYVLKDTDKLYLGILEPNHSWENAILRKIYTKDNLNADGDVIIKLEPEDTEYLSEGIYYYQIKLLQVDENNNEIVTTIIPSTKLYLI